MTSLKSETCSFLIITKVKLEVLQNHYQLLSKMGVNVCLMQTGRRRLMIL